MSAPEELENVETYRWGQWQEAEDYLPPLGRLVVASDGKEYWLDMRLEVLPDLGWKDKRVKYWCAMESLCEFLNEKHRQELAAKRAAEDPDVIF